MATWDKVEAAFPDYPVASLPALPAGFVDSSWHNDACPSMTPTDESLVVFVDYPDEAERELSGVKRFSVQTLIDDTAGPHELINTDDWAEVLATIQAFKEGDGTMTRDEALQIVIDLATRWGENAEEALPTRLTAEMTDDDLDKIVGDSDMATDDYDRETAREVRDLWRAIAILQQKGETT